ncbi:MAG: histone deacetylase family protein, partial [Thermoprotei archaeon]
MYTGVVYGRVFLKHDTGPDHIERGARLLRILKALRASGLVERAGLKLVRPVPVEESKLLYVHSQALVDKVKEACSSSGYIDSDTVTSPGS